MSEEKKVTLGDLSGELRALKQQKSDLYQQEKELNAQIEKVTHKIICAMEDNGLENIKHDGFSVTMTTELMPNLVDREAFWKYIRETDTPSLIQQRVSAAAFRELVAHGEEVPGVESYEKTKLNTRNL